MNETADGAVLIGLLAAHGVRHLRARRQVEAFSISQPDALIAGLALHPNPRLRESLIVLFLRQPAYAVYVSPVEQRLPSDAGLTLQHMYTASVYLQRFWRSTLGIYLGDFAQLPDIYGQVEFGLPAPDDHYGETGLRKLAALFQERTGYDWLSTYHAAISLLFAQLSLDRAEQDEQSS